MSNAKAYKTMKKNLKALLKVTRVLKIPKIMRLTAFLLTFAVTQVFAGNTYSQKTNLTLNLCETDLELVLKEIETQSEFYFCFNQKLIDTDRKVSLQVREEKIDKVLNQIFSGMDVEYIVLDRQIILSPKEYLKSSNAKVKPQSIRISGTVKDEKGDPLPGVTVKVKGTVCRIHPVGCRNCTVYDAIKSVPALVIGIPVVGVPCYQTGGRNRVHGCKSHIVTVNRAE